MTGSNPAGCAADGSARAGLTVCTPKTGRSENSLVGSGEELPQPAAKTTAHAPIIRTRFMPSRMFDYRHSTPAANAESDTSLPLANEKGGFGWTGASGCARGISPERVPHTASCRVCTGNRLVGEHKSHNHGDNKSHTEPDGQHHRITARMSAHGGGPSVLVWPHILPATRDSAHTSEHVCEGRLRVRDASFVLAEVVGCDHHGLLRIEVRAKVIRRDSIGTGARGHDTR